MKRGEKVRAVARYLTGHTGIPFIKEIPHQNRLEAPRGYGFLVTTDGSLQRFWAAGYETDRNMIDVAIRFDNRLQQVDDSMVLMRLNVFARLLATYHESKEQ
jgi:hypothetical protein